MKIASFNVENLFDRAKAFNDDTKEARDAIKLESQLNLLFQKTAYSTATQTKILTVLDQLGILRTDEGPYVRLRKIRGQLLKRPRTGAVEIVATGRADWVGWVELKTAHVNETAILNTGRVIRDVNADILAVVEAEDRVALKQFSEFVLGKVGGIPYEQIMLIDGNDDRGIDVGLMTRNGYKIDAMRSNIHEMWKQEPLFSRDCPEYRVITATGEELYILPNHFKSKFGGNTGPARDKRAAQAAKVAEIYKRLIAEGKKNIVVLGDLNDTPDSDALQPLLSLTDLKDVSAHPTFDTGAFAGQGTFGLGNDRDKIDYLLLSPTLFLRIKTCGLFRKGAWPGVRPQPRWEVYPELQRELHAASDHHLIWCELE